MWKYMKHLHLWLALKPICPKGHVYSLVISHRSLWIFLFEENNRSDRFHIYCKPVNSLFRPILHDEVIRRDLGYESEVWKKLWKARIKLEIKRESTNLCCLRTFSCSVNVECQSWKWRPVVRSNCLHACMWRVAILLYMVHPQECCPVCHPYRSTKEQWTYMGPGNYSDICCLGVEDTVAEYMELHWYFPPVPSVLCL